LSFNTHILTAVLTMLHYFTMSPCASGVYLTIRVTVLNDVDVSTSVYHP